MNAEYAYEMIDRFLRNNLGDNDYAEYSEALDAIYVPSKAGSCEAGAICLQCPDREANEDYKRGFQDGLAELGDMKHESYCQGCGTRLADKCDVCQPRAEP